MVKVCIQEVNDLGFNTLTFPECPYFQKTDEIEFNEEYPDDGLCKHPDAVWTCCSTHNFEGIDCPFDIKDEMRK